ncbi:MAG: response regulator transcription factor [Chitinophagaceae bacterium]|nr:response regulator transcription factor [Chitinophagaceae bacterium]
MKAIIIDDEQHCIKTLQWTLAQYCAEIEIIAAASNAASGKQLIELHQPELVFLDIEMPVMNGIEMIKSLDKVNFEIIFTTAYDKYAINAFRLNALDFLLKPIDKDYLIEAVEKLKAKNHKIESRQIDNLYQIHKTKIIDKIAISTSEGLQFISLQNIIRIEANGSYCNFYLIDGKKILLSKKLGDVEDILNMHEDFFRVHKSNIINLKYVEKYIKGEGGEIQMIDKTIIGLSRSKKAEFLELFAKV